MQGKLIFVSGTHGSGKTTFCKILAKQSGVLHVTASELIQAGRQLSHKMVENIPENQEILLNELTFLKKTHKGTILLDWHSCLLEKNGNIVNLGIELFRQIQPDIIFLVEAKSILVQSRLYKRDGIIWELTTIKKFQDMERVNTKEIANKLRIPLAMVEDFDPSTSFLIPELLWKYF